MAVLGGTGHFGARICRRLAKEPGLDLVVTSRSRSRAEALAAEIRAHAACAGVSGSAFDQEHGDLVGQLRRLTPTIVIHTAGPYQSRDYRVAEACIAAGCHYVDLADGRDFVAGFDTLDVEAQDAGVTLVSGASTLPGLSSAVVDGLSPRFRHIESIETSIAPAHRSPRGRATIESVLSYCGVPVGTWRAGERQRVHGWQDLRWQRYPSLGRRLFAACDVPDLALFPEYYPGVRNVTFHAALEAPWEQLGLRVMAWLTRAGLVRDWTRFALPLAALSRRRIVFGSVCGGMLVRIAGTDSDGHRQTLRWELIPGRNHGPEIPCTPAIVVAQKILNGSASQPGARACLGQFSVDEFLNELCDFDVSARLLGGP